MLELQAQKRMGPNPDFQKFQENLLVCNGDISHLTEVGKIQPSIKELSTSRYNLCVQNLASRGQPLEMGLIVIEPE